MKSPIVNGEWIHQEGDQYVVIGVDRNNQRFTRTSDSWFYINGINVWKGNKWLLRKGKKYLIQSITN